MPNGKGPLGLPRLTDKAPFAQPEDAHRDNVINVGDSYLAVLATTDSPDKAADVLDDAERGMERRFLSLNNMSKMTGDFRGDGAAAVISRVMSVDGRSDGATTVNQIENNIATVARDRGVPISTVVATKTTL